MKRVYFVLLATGITFSAIAQRSAINSANNYLRDKDYEHAKEYIEKAVADPSTAKDPKTWYTRGLIFATMQDDPKLSSTSPYKEAAKSFLKVVEIKPDYQKEDVDNALVKCLFNYYNEGVNTYNSGKYEAANELMQDAVKITSLENGKRFSKYKFAPTIDTISAQSKNIVYLSNYQLKKYDEALVVLKEIKNNPILKKPSMYVDMSDIYLSQHKDTEFLATLEEAKTMYPNDMGLRIKELNYYMDAGKVDELVGKLEESVKKFPENTVILSVLASTYAQLATKQGAKDKAGYEKKAEESYKKLLAQAPDTPIYNYNAGVLYYDQAVGLNDQMNAITGTSAPETKKYNDLKASRDAMFSNAIPYFEKTYAVLSSRPNLNAEDKGTLHNAMLGLKECYAKTDKLEKATQMKNKIESMH